MVVRPPLSRSRHSAVRALWQFAPFGTSRRLAVRAIWQFALLGFSVSCATAPRAGPLTGVPVAASVPDTRLRHGYRRTVFSWEYKERVFSAKGDGVARIAPPDSVRIDLFLENGAYAGFVIMIADSLTRVAQDEARRSLPPPPLLWAALGVVRVTAPDTIARQDGDTLRVQIGGEPAWRLAFTSRLLARMERIAAGKIEQTVERGDSTRIVYRQPGAGKSLVLTVRGFFAEAGFDAAIWRP